MFIMHPLLYCCYAIMASQTRYVEGYRVDSNAYDHEGHAQVKDSDAHAWVEIFDEPMDGCLWK